MEYGHVPGREGRPPLSIVPVFYPKVYGMDNMISWAARMPEISATDQMLLHDAKPDSGIE